MGHAMAKADCRKLRRRRTEGIIGPAQLQRHRHILLRRHGGQQMEALQHNAEPVPPYDRQRIFIQRPEIRARHLNRPAGRLLQPGQDGHQRAFAGARWAEQRHALALLDIQIDPMQNVHARVSIAQR